MDMENNQDNIENVDNTPSDNQENDISSNTSDESSQSDDSNEELDSSDAAGSSDEEKSDDDKSLEELSIPEESKEKTLPKWAEKRLTKKERELSQIAAEKAKLEAELEQIKAENTANFKNTDFADPVKEDFDSERDYIVAVLKHEAAKANAKQQEIMKNKYLQENEAKFRNNLDEALKKGSEKYNDFDDKTEVLFSAEFPPNRAMAEAIVSSQFKDDILYFLGTYPDKAKEIAKLNPVEAAMKIGEIQSRFMARAKNNTTKMPSPINPINTNKSKGNIVSNLQDLDKIAKLDDQAAFEAAVKKIARQKKVF